MIQWLFSSSVLIIAVLLVRAAFQKKVSRRLVYGAWLLVAVRLLIPFSLSAPQQTPVAFTNVSAAQEYITSQTITQPALGGGENTGEQTPAQLQKTVPLESVLKTVWLCGSIAIGLWFIFVNLHFGRRLKRGRTRMAVDQCELPVYAAENIATPCLFGLFHPAIYITPDILENSTRLNHVITHEICHHRQGDHVFSLVRALCLAVHWFSPLVWLAAVCSRNDCELACDELALKTLGDEEKLSYGRTLVGLASVPSSPSLLLSSATSMSASAGQMKKRITLIASGKKPVLALSACALCLLLVMSGCSFLSAGGDTPQPPANSETIAGYNRYEIEYPRVPQTEQPFTLSIALPDGWEVESAGDNAVLSGNFYEHLAIYQGDVYIGYIGYNIFEPYSADDVPPEDYYKTVYPDLRLSSAYIWDIGTSVLRTETAQTHLATVEYIDPAALASGEYDGQRPDAPTLQAQAILHYDTAFGVYVGIQFTPGTLATEQQIQAIAQSISLF